MIGYQPYNYQTVDERIWVQNEIAAEAYLVAPNSFVRLWDANKPVFYEKRTDVTGRPMPMETFEYTRKTPTEASLQTGGGIDYQKELEGLMRRVEALEKGVNNELSKSNADDTGV